MPLLAKIVLAALFLFVMYWVSQLGIWGVGHWGWLFTLPALALLFLYGAWHDGYTSRGGLQKFIREQLPLKLQKVLLNVGLLRADDAEIGREPLNRR
jgi:hypothetical protein